MSSSHHPHAHTMHTLMTPGRRIATPMALWIRQFLRHNVAYGPSNGPWSA